MHSTSQAARRSLPYLVAVWCLAAAALWLWRGWVFWTPAPPIPGDIPWEAPLAQLRALGAVIALAVCCWGLGTGVSYCLHLDVKAGRTLTAAFDLAVGLCVATLLLLVVGFIGLLPYGMLVLFVGLAGAPVGWSRLKSAESSASAWPETRVMSLVGSALVLAAALAPAVESDGLRYHLFLPQEWLKAGGIVHLRWHAFTNLPSMTQTLFMPAMEWGGMRAPQLVHALTWLLLLGFSCALGERIARAAMAGGDGDDARAHRLGAAAGLVGAASPVCLVVASWPNVDVASAAFLTAGLWALCPGSLRRLDSRLLAAGLFFGAAAACKLPAAGLGAVAGLFALGQIAVRPRKARRVALFVVPGLVMFAPWLVKNAVYHGNPVYPAAYGTFGGDEWSPENDAFYKAKAAEKGVGRSTLDFALAPLDVTIRWKQDYLGDPLVQRAFLEGDGYPSIGERLWSRASPGFEDHNPGPAFLALLPLSLLAVAIALRRRSFALMLAAAVLVAGAIIWFLAYQSVRFLMPVLVVNAVLSVGVLARGPTWLGRAVLGALAFLGLAWGAWYFAFAGATRPFAGAIGRVPEEALLATRFNAWPAIDELNDSVPEGEAVFVIGEHRGAYAEYDVILSDWFDTPRVLVAIRGTEDNDALIDLLRERGVTRILYNGRELAAYRDVYFRSRFSDDEWRRYEDLLDRLGVEDRDALQVVTLPQ